MGALDAADGSARRFSACTRCSYSGAHRCSHTRHKRSSWSCGRGKGQSRRRQWWCQQQQWRRQQRWQHLRHGSARVSRIAQAVPRGADRHGGQLPVVAVPHHVSPLDARAGLRPGGPLHRADRLHAAGRVARRPSGRARGGDTVAFHARVRAGRHLSLPRLPRHQPAPQRHLLPQVGPLRRAAGGVPPHRRDGPRAAAAHPESRRARLADGVPLRLHGPQPDPRALYQAGLAGGRRGGLQAGAVDRPVARAHPQGRPRGGGGAVERDGGQAQDGPAGRPRPRLGDRDVGLLDRRRLHRASPPGLPRLPGRARRPLLRRAAGRLPSPLLDLPLHLPV
mmetsp:Transcript_14271/g.48005  ORF Transcript_14271/g.48005 Transcript_14271/m.48005 type:complete len:336 (-) Transcript_14271:782-1789(-)